MLADLAHSGLDEADARRLGCRIVLRGEAERLVGHARAGYVIPYRDERGKDTGFFRVKFLEDPDVGRGRPATNFARYAQPPGTPPALYVPPCLDAKLAKAAWPELLADPKRNLIVTEGEKKAACAAARGFQTVAIGGVDAYRSRAKGWVLLPELEAIAWSGDEGGRPVYLVFDSDLRLKPQVANALVGLAFELTRRGAVPRIVYLPDLDGVPKTGLDDFLVAEGDAAFTDLLSQAEPFSEAGALWKMNEHYAVIRTADAVLSLDARQLHHPKTFLSITAAHERHAVTTQTAMGVPKTKVVSTAKAWLEWPHRRTHKKLVYAPGEPEILADSSFNLWRDTGPKPEPPRRGELDAFDELVGRLFERAPELREWFLSWVAYPLQHPGTKLDTAVLVHGTKQGTGKTMLGRLIGALYGPDNFAVVDSDQFFAAFNPWAVNRQFVLVDEVIAGDKRRDADLLKLAVTRKEITVNVKYQPHYVVADVMNYFFTSNHPDALRLENDDRRFAVIEVASDILPSAFADRVAALLAGRGPGALLHRFLHRDCAGFMPHAPAPQTEAKRTMIAVGRSAVEAFAARVARAPEEVLRYGASTVDGDLWTAMDLVRLPGFLDGAAVTNPIGAHQMATSLGRALRRQGVVARALDNYGLSLFIVRNPERWCAAPPQELHAHYQKTRGAVPDGSQPPNLRAVEGGRKEKF